MGQGEVTDDGILLKSKSVVISAGNGNEEDPLIKHHDDQPEDVNKFPTSIRFIMSNEICERFSYYGLRAILALYLSKQLGFTDDRATVWVHAFTMGAYATTVLGGWLSDAILGKFRTIFYVSQIYCVGSALLSLTAFPNFIDSGTWGVGLGLALIALGTGGIKPVASAFMGDQFSQAQAHLLERAFRMWYFCINLGSVFSTILTPIIREKLNYGYAFGLPAVLLVVATMIFWSGKPRYKIHDPAGSVLSDACKMFYFAARARLKYGPHPEGKSFLYLAVGAFPVTLVQDVIAAGRVLLVFVPLPFFWALFDQHSSRWIFQADQMNRDLFGLTTIAPDQVPAINPILVLILVPVFDQIIYPTIARFRPLRPLQRMAVGMVLTGGAFVLAGFLEIYIGEHEVNTVSIFMQLPQYVVLGAGEIMVSITGLEFAYTQAPRSMKSIIMSGWLLTVAVGNGIVVIITEVSKFDMWKQYFFFAGLMIVAMFIFSIIAYMYKKPQVTENE